MEEDENLYVMVTRRERERDRDGKEEGEKDKRLVADLESKPLVHVFPD